MQALILLPILIARLFIQINAVGMTENYGLHFSFRLNFIFIR